MVYSVDDTIAAIASAPGPAARGIVRLSGPDVLNILQQCFTAPRADWQQQRRAARTEGTLELDAPLGPVPCELYYWPGARSYTRQPTAELHLVGSPPIVEAALARVCRLGARLANPGEFTLRAFLAGRLDLTQAEAVLGVIDAASRRELDVALRQLAGGLATPLHRIREQLLDLVAHLEAGLDFVEEDIEFLAHDELLGQLAAAERELDELLAQLGHRAHREDVARITLRGLPNAGKSSLLNALAGTDTALVSDEAGTTRDYLTHSMTLDGLACQFIDTAGVESAAPLDEIQQAAQHAAHQQVQDAHLEVLCIDRSRPLADWEFEQLRRPPAATRLVVLTKVDLPAGIPESQHPLLAGAIETSARSGTGLQQLRSAIRRQFLSSDSAIGFLDSTSQRCRDSIDAARRRVAEARATAEHFHGEDLVAAELRLALDELGRTVGAVYTDDILDRIFSRFCIGK